MSCRLSAAHLSVRGAIETTEAKQARLIEEGPARVFRSDLSIQTVLIGLIRNERIEMNESELESPFFCMYLFKFHLSITYTFYFLYN